MKEYINNEGQLRLLWDTIRVNMERVMGFKEIDNFVIQGPLKWIIDKQNQFRGDEYLMKIENNAIYLSEASSACLDVTTDYLCHKGKFKIPQQEIQSFVYSIRQNAIQPAIAHQNYIRSGCSGCYYHNYHNYYKTLYQMKRYEKPKIYLEEIEFVCIFNQMKFLIVQEFLITFLKNKEFSGIVKNLSPEEVKNTLNEKAGITVQLWGKIVQISTSKPNNTVKKTWQEIWAQDLKNLSI